MDVPLLSVSGLTTAFHSEGRWRPVLNGISFDVMPEETVALVGESGSGKSVTSLSIMQLLPRDAARITGQVRFRGTDLLALSPRQMNAIRGNDIAMIFQEPMTSLNPVMTVGAQIAEVLMTHKGIGHAEALDRAATMLERVRIPSARRRVGDFPHEFSGGMRQRVMIAIALACNPTLLIADEPTTALDVTVQAQVMDLLKDIQREERMSMLFITHDMGVVAEMADRTVVMYQGDIVETGPTTQVFEAPQRPYTRALLSAIPRLGAMAGTDRPMRFPVVDKETGQSDVPVAVGDTVRTDLPPVLTAERVVTRFDLRSPLLRRVVSRVHAVEDVSFELRVGETLSLVGESGCGKSTTGRSLLRLIEPVSGQIAVAGQDVLGRGATDLRQLRQQIQMIFQDPFASLNPRLTVGQAIAEPLFIHNRANAAQARETVRDLLVQVGLDPAAASRYPHEFSGGQRQRICIARALTLEPKVIVADEAVSALDASVKAQVINLMLDLQERLGLSYLFISHDMAVVERISHRVAVMYLGEIVEIGPRRSVFENPMHPYTRKLMSAVPVPDPRLRGKRPPMPVDELRNPLRPANFVPPVRSYVEVAPGHFVQQAQD